MAREMTARFGQAFLTIFSVITLTFVMIRMIPGGPMDYLMAQAAASGDQQAMERAERLAEIYINVNPREPIWIQYIDYMSSMLMLDFGVSIWYNDPVIEILGRAMPWTVLVMSSSILLTFIIGVVLGAVMAYKEGGTFDVSNTLVAIFLTSVPYYVAAILFVYILGYQWGMFPTGGHMPQGVQPGLNWSFFTGVLYHATLPVASLVITSFGGTALSMRGNSIRVLGEDYIRVANLRGVTDNRIAILYVGRNAVLPLYTSLLISIGFMFGGSIILEEIFAYPGIGYYMFKSISSRDYPLMMGAFILITVAVVIGILFADMTYSKIDPRAEGGGSREAF